MRDSLKRWAQFALGQPFSPVMLNILVTSVCNMRCTHCFFTDELDDAPRKKLQMTTRADRADLRNAGRQSGRAGSRRRRAVHRAPTCRKSRARSTPTTSSGSLYITSNGVIQKRIFPDITAHLAGMSAPQCDHGAGHRRAQGAARQDSPAAGLVGNRHGHRAPPPGDEAASIRAWTCRPAPAS